MAYSLGEGIMPRRSRDLADVEFFIRFLTKPFVSPNWACAYMAIGAAMTLMHALLIGAPSSQPDVTPIDAMWRPVQELLTLRYLIPALAFNIVGILGLLVCILRDWRERRA